MIGLFTGGNILIAIVSLQFLSGAAFLLQRDYGRGILILLYGVANIVAFYFVQ